MVFDPGGHVLIVVGTRPEVIKLAPVVESLRAHGLCTVTLCAVTQHTNLLGETLRDWRLVPDVEIRLTRHKEGPSAILAEMMPAMGRVIRDHRPAVLVVQGDTITGMGAALAAGYEQVPVAHVEAGLRTGDLMQPFPEEMQRIVIDRISAVRYAPTEQARANLLAEGCEHDSVVVVGNTVVDALRLILARPHTSGLWERSALRRVLVTAHRRENFGEGVASICDAVIRLAETRTDVDVVYVLHPNPNARDPAVSALSGRPRVRLVEPLGYPEFVQSMAAADVIITDSGGIQEEGPYLGTPVLVTREVTERPEVADQGRTTLVGTDPAVIVETVGRVLDGVATGGVFTEGVAGPYGDGRASERIRTDLFARLGIPEPEQCRPGGNLLFAPDLVAWLQSDQVVAADGGVRSWWNPDRPGYRYPEIAGLLLNLLTQRNGHPGLRRSIAAGLAADTNSDGAIGRDGVGYTFDTAMSLSGLLREQAATGTLPDPDLPVRQYRSLRAGLRARRATAPATPPAGHWSTTYGCHLLKTTLALTAFSRATGEDVEDLVDQLISDLVPLAAGGRFRIHKDATVTYLHAHCYAIEGLLALSAAAPGSVHAEIEAGAEWLARVQDPTGGLRAWHDGAAAAGDLRADATAQAVRIWSLVDREAFNEPISAATKFLTQLLAPGGGIRYGPDSQDVNSWATIFTVQALDWAERQGDPSCIV